MREEPGWPSRPALLWLLLLLPLAAGLQSVFAARLLLFGGQPDFVLTVALTCALLSDAATGALLGAAAGLFSGALCGQAVGAYMASRSLAGFLAGGFTARLYGTNPGVVLLGVFVASVVSEILFGLAAPRLSLLHWVQSALVGGAMNALLAVPLSFLLRRLGWGRAR
jgi:rod shape-determining protein MreD